MSETKLPLGEQCHFYGCHIPVSEHAGRSNHPPHGVCKCCNTATPIVEMTGEYCKECGAHRVQSEDAPPLYVRFGNGLVDENGDSVDFLVNTRAFSDSVEYAPVRSAKQALRPTMITYNTATELFCNDDTDIDRFIERLVEAGIVVDMRTR